MKGEEEACEEGESWESDPPDEEHPEGEAGKAEEEGGKADGDFAESPLIGAAQFLPSGEREAAEDGVEEVIIRNFVSPERVEPGERAEVGAHPDIFEVIGIGGAHEEAVEVDTHGVVFVAPEALGESGCGHEAGDEDHEEEVDCEGATGE